MKIKFKCECGKRIKSSMKRVGCSLQCPLCQRTIKIPDAKAENVLLLECSCQNSFSPHLQNCPFCETEVKTTFKEKEKFIDDIALVPKQRINIFYILWGICIIFTLLSCTYIFLNFTKFKALLATWTK